MIQDLIPWVAFGGGWESRLNIGNINGAATGGPVQVGFTLMPGVPVTNGVRNHLPAFFTDDSAFPNPLRQGESSSYALAQGKSVNVHFLYPPAGCDVNGQNCSTTADPNTLSSGSLMVSYVATNPAYLRGLAKAQVTFLAQTPGSLYGWQATESEVAPARMWKAPVSVTAKKNANPPANQEASAALANPGTQPVNVTATLYDQFGSVVTSKDVTIPAQGVTAFVFSQNPSGLFGGFGSAMFPAGTDFTGWVTFEVTSPSDGAITPVVLQVVGDSLSSVAVQPFSASVPVATQQANPVGCAEFQPTGDGGCMLQDLIPWVAFGGGLESRLNIGNIPSGTASGRVQVSFALVPGVPSANGLQNHLTTFFTDNRAYPYPLQLGESASYILSQGESVDVHFLYPPAGCDAHGQKCSNTPDPNTLAFGSLLVSYAAIDPAYLRGLAKAQVTFLAQTPGRLYGWQAAEQEVASARMWKAPVSVTADKNANPRANQEASAAIANPGTSPVTVMATLYDQNGAAITSKSLQIPAQGVTAFVFSSNQNGFGSAMFPQGMDFSGWVTFEATSPKDGAVTLVVLQVVGDSMTSVNVQSFP